MTRFGLQIPSFTFPGADDRETFECVAELVTAAEGAGFDSLWVMDHFWQLPPLGGPDQPMLEGYTLLGALAARTHRAELGTLVTGVMYRNPALVAKMVTTLDVISQGRAICGIGAAWYEEEHDALGFDFPPVRERMDRLEEALTIIRAMFVDVAPTFEGRYYRIEGAKNVPRPIRDGGPPIMVGGSGEQRTLRIVAKYADICNVFGSPDTLRHKFDVLERHCADFERDPTEITKSWLGTLVLTDTADEAEGVKELLSSAIGPDWQERSIVGDADGVFEQVSALVDTGLDMIIFNMPTSDADAVSRAGELLVSKLG